jgi:hypothetical protein
MNQKVLTKKPAYVNIKWLANHLRVEEGSEDYEIFEAYCNKAIGIAVPKAVYRVSYIEETSDESIRLDGSVFSSSLMIRNFKNIHRVFPYAVTCGTEVYKWAEGVTDIIERYWVDNIMEAILRDMIIEMYNEIKRVYGIEKLSSMNPGSLEGWPIQQQAQLFGLIGSVKESTGITLTDSFLMIPQKSVSGIYFPSGSEYSNCKLCERKNCPSRRDPFDKGLHESLTGK